MLMMKQHFEKEYGVRKSSISEMQNGLTKRRKCYLKNNTVKITKVDVKRKLTLEDLFISESCIEIKI